MKGYDLLDQKRRDKYPDSFHTKLKSNCIPLVLFCEVIDSK
jgi:hypothetical protein